MNSNDWKSELSHMLEVIEKQSTASLGKINQQFKALGLPFDENFRQDVVKMTNFRFVINRIKLTKSNEIQSDLFKNYLLNTTVSTKLRFII